MAHPADSAIAAAKREGQVDKLPGGLAVGKSSEDFDPDQLAKGSEVEMEHTDDPDIAVEIAMDHLTEIPDYYDRLERMEQQASRSGSCNTGKGAVAAARRALYKDERGYEVGGGEVREHRNVMEKKLKRKLKPTEDVHHVDGDKSNNAPSNLEVVDHAERARKHQEAKGKEAQAVYDVPLSAVVNEIKTMADGDADVIDIIVAIHDRYPAQAASALMEAQRQGIINTEPGAAAM
jgi:hypothetical protein